MTEISPKDHPVLHQQLKDRWLIPMRTYTRQPNHHGPLSAADDDPRYYYTGKDADVLRLLGGSSRVNMDLLMTVPGYGGEQPHEHYPNTLLSVLLVGVVYYPSPVTDIVCVTTGHSGRE